MRSTTLLRTVACVCTIGGLVCASFAAEQVSKSKLQELAGNPTVGKTPSVINRAAIQSFGVDSVSPGQANFGMPSMPATRGPGIACPPGGVQEGEANCGQPDDTFDGGCNPPNDPNAPALFTLNCGDTLCGTVFTMADGAGGFSRDTDWLRLTLTGVSTITLTFESEFPGVAGFLDGNTCQTVTAIDPLVTTTGAGDVQSVSATFGAGEVWMFVSGDPTVAHDFPCGATYTLQVACGAPAAEACCFPADGSCMEIDAINCAAMGGQPQGAGTTCATVTCPVAPANDLCDNAIPVGPLPASVLGTTIEATLDAVPLCGTSIGAPGVWYSVVGDGNTLTATTCSANTDYDTKLNVYCGSCEEQLFCQGGNDDAGSACAINSLHSQVSWCTIPGQVYLILVQGFSGTGNFELTVSSDGTPCNTPIPCEPCVIDCPCTCPGDIDGDCSVGLSDLGILLSNYNQMVPPNTGGDLNGDGMVTLSDIGILFADWDCVGSAVQVVEPDCGLPEDTVNPGCNGPDPLNPILIDVACGDVICDSVASDSALGLRDTDWFRLVLTSESGVTITGNAEAPILFGIAEQIVPGVGGCDNLTGFFGASGTINDACGFASFTLCLGPGEYYLVVVAGNFDDIPCPSDYTLTIDCGPCPTGACCLLDQQGTCIETTEPDCLAQGGEYQGDGVSCMDVTCPIPPPNNDCGSAQAITVPFVTQVDTTLATNSGGPEGSCNSTAAVGMDNDIWYTYTPSEDCSLVILVNPTNYDGLTAVYTGADCNSLTEVACADEPEPHQILINAIAGTTYWIQIGDWGTADGGGITDISVDCTLMAPTAACCFSDGSCQDLSSADCTAAGGAFQGLGTSCATVTCPITPDNNTCGTATVVMSLPFSDAPDTSQATNSGGPAGSCNSSAAVGMDNDVWYVYTPTSDCILDVTLDGAYDLVAAVYTGTDCANLTELACGDPEPINFQIFVTAGQTYWIQVGDWGTADGGGPTTVAIDCQANDPGACCFSDGSCQELTEDVCLASGGSFGGRGTLCANVTCFANDECVDAVAISGQGSFEFDTTFATDVGPDEAECTFFSQVGFLGDVWYCWTADATGNATIDTCGNNLDTKIAVYDGCTCPDDAAAPLACNDDSNDVCSGTLQSSVTIPVVQGNSYLIRIGGYPSTTSLPALGRGNLNIAIN